mgnify:CR=1 FL=1
MFNYELTWASNTETLTMSSPNLVFTVSLATVNPKCDEFDNEDLYRMKTNGFFCYVPVMTTLPTPTLILKPLNIYQLCLLTVLTHLLKRVQLVGQLKK